MNKELNEKIALLIEPKPTFVHDWESSFTNYLNGTPYQTRAWVEVHIYENRDEAEWYPKAFDENPADVRLLEDWIAEQGLMREYGLSLAGELGLFDNEREMDDWEGKDVFAIAHASPEVRCIAALEMMSTRTSDPTQGTKTPY